MIKKQPAQRIAELRRGAGYTQERLAGKAGYSVEFISFVERGINAPSVEGCGRLVKAPGLPLKDIFDFNGDGHPAS